VNNSSLGQKAKEVTLPLLYPKRHHDSTDHPDGEESGTTVTWKKSGDSRGIKAGKGSFSLLGPNWFSAKKNSMAS